MVCAKFVQIIYVREWKIQQEGRKLCHSAALLEQGKIKIIREEEGERRKERREDCKNRCCKSLFQHQLAECKSY